MSRSGPSGDGPGARGDNPIWLRQQSDMHEGWQMAGEQLVGIVVDIEHDADGYWVVATTDHPLLEPQRTGPFASEAGAAAAADDLRSMLAAVEVGKH
mgnify:FL=1